MTFRAKEKQMDTREKFDQYMITEFAPAMAPFVAQDGKDATLTDTGGQVYIDAFAGIAVTNAGHGNRMILDAARAQLDRLLHTCTYMTPHQPAADLAESLAAIAPGRLVKTFFGSSGAEANEAALRLARQFTGRNEFIALQGAFHGRTYATLSLSGLCTRKRDGGPWMPGVSFAPAPYSYRSAVPVSEGNATDLFLTMLRDTLRFTTSDNVAAMIVEPIMGEGGIIVPPNGYLPAVKEFLEKHGILLIADEVQTGFGRTGKMFAIEHDGIEPDIMTLGKGIANGLPLSAMMTRPEIAAAFKPGDHLSTFGGNPVSCAAALATIEFHHREHLAQQAADKGAAIMDALRERIGSDPHVGEIRGRGLMIGIELVEDTDKTPAPKLARSIVAHCRARHILIGCGGMYGNVIRIQPPLVITPEQLGKVTDAICEGLAQ
jgi:4-aminobutyrate aminotransferase / (S)-3-amino-2-methylpropionate transaminase / 5-aminovalerate transaminase